MYDQEFFNMIFNDPLFQAQDRLRKRAEKKFGIPEVKESDKERWEKTHRFINHHLPVLEVMEELGMLDVYFNNTDGYDFQI